MQALLIGYTTLNFKSSSGDEINGTQLFYGYTDEKIKVIKNTQTSVNAIIEIAFCLGESLLTLFSKA